MNSKPATARVFARALKAIAITTLSYGYSIAGEAIAASVPTQATHNTSLITPPISCAPVVEGSHYNISCETTATLLDKAQTAPVFSSPCDLPLEITSSEAQFALGYAYHGFTGYFAPARWQAIKNKGDGGVDVTGAPDGSLLVEGANNASVRATARKAAEWLIAIPAEGYVSFDWRPIGGSNLFQVLVNDLPVLEAGASARGGSFFSPLLHTGDMLALRLSASENSDMLIGLDNFRMLTNAVGVITRHWSAIDTEGNRTDFTQLLSLNRLSVAQVVFPGDYVIHYEQLMEAAAYPEPILTGLPVLDQDGNPITVADQHTLDQCQCGYALSYEDEVVSIGTDCIVTRKWYVADRFSGNNMTHKQTIRISDGLPGCKPPAGALGAPDDDSALPPQLRPDMPTAQANGTSRR